MTFSLNEIEAMGKRAARGAGLDWGLAEEAGKAARWLAAHGLPGPELLAELLSRNDGRSYAELAPGSTNGTWTAPSGALCPLIAGAALCDRAAQIAAGGRVSLGPTACPLLLAPYAALGAASCNAGVEVSWAGVTLTVSPGGGLRIEGDPAALAVDLADGVACGPARRGPVAPSAQEPGRAVDAGTWGRLGALAHRTFAPATEASRTLGAGAGVIDND